MASFDRLNIQYRNLPKKLERRSVTLASRGQDRAACPQCRQTFRWPVGLAEHEREAHPSLWNRFVRFIDDL